jgi:nicotinate-nucleotide adenylyltransferase
MRLGIFGGSFDPVHLGHLELASCCQRQVALDQVWFVPAAVQPFKRHGPSASNEDRCAMLRLAFAERADWRLSTIEIDRGGFSYAFETVQAIHARHPDWTLFLLMGADSLYHLPAWKNPEEICRLATPLAVGRPGQPEADYSALAALIDSRRLSKMVELGPIEMRAMPISSSAIRQRIAQGKAVDQLIPADVAEYIADRGLYRDSGSAQ